MESVQKLQARLLVVQQEERVRAIERRISDIQSTVARAKAAFESERDKPNPTGSESAIKMNALRNSATTPKEWKKVETEYRALERENDRVSTAFSKQVDKVGRLCDIYLKASKDSKQELATAQASLRIEKAQLDLLVAQYNATR